MESVRARIGGLPGHARVGGSGPPLVLVHGLAVSSLYFLPLARLLERRFRVYAPDLPGYGRSATPAAPLGIPESADALREWLDLWQLESAPLVGNSLGCQFLVDLAVRAPQRVERLVLIGPTMDSAAPTILAQMGRLARDVIREPVGLNLAELRDYARMGPRRILATARLALDDPLEQKLPRVEAPALVVRGARDPIAPQTWAERVTSLLPRGRLAVVPGSAHAAHWSAAAEVARLVEEG